MDVLYFHQHFSTPEGSTGLRSYEMAQHLIRRGHAVTMVCGSYSGSVTGLAGPFRKGLRRGSVHGIEVVELDLAYSNSDSFSTRTRTFLRFATRSVLLVLRERFDVIFATTTPLTAGIPGIIARRLRGKPFVFEVRDLWPELPREMGVIVNPLVLGLMSMLEWMSYRSAHRLIGLSPGIVHGIERRGIPSDRVCMVPNGCDLDLFGSKVTPWRPTGVSDKDLMAVFAGTHGVANGLDAALDAAAELKKRGRADIKLVLLGSGKLKGELMARAEGEKLSNILFHDPVPKAQLAGLLTAADLGMQILANIPAFYYGTSPNKFFDYIAAGLPVLNNYPGWLADLIQSNACGFAVEPESPTAFADALEAAADNRAALKSMGARSRRLAEEQFRRSLLADRLVDWIEGIDP